MQFVVCLRPKIQYNLKEKVYVKERICVSYILNYMIKGSYVSCILNGSYNRVIRKGLNTMFFLWFS